MWLFAEAVAEVALIVQIYLYLTEHKLSDSSSEVFINTFQSGQSMNSTGIQTFYCVLASSTKSIWGRKHKNSQFSNLFIAYPYIT